MRVALQRLARTPKLFRNIPPNPNQFRITAQRATATAKIFEQKLAELDRHVGLANIPSQILELLHRGKRFSATISEVGDVGIELLAAPEKHPLKDAPIATEILTAEFDALFKKVCRLYTGILGSAEYDGGTWEAAHLGEAVSEKRHALLTAYFGTLCGLGPNVVALLLHDFGHLNHDSDINSARNNIDTQHEKVGLPFLIRFQGRDIAIPAFYHVQAKQWWAHHPRYAHLLSRASTHSLNLQNNTAEFDEARLKRFERSSHAELALTLRLIEDLFGKINDAGFEVPSFDFYRSAMEFNFSRTMQSSENPTRKIRQMHDMLDRALQRSAELERLLSAPTFRSE